MIKILITGGAGFIPSSLAGGLIASSNYYVVAVDNFITGNSSNLPRAENFKFIKCDVNNYEDIAPVMMHYGFDYVFHYAALVGVKRTLDNPLLVLRDIDGFKNIFGLAKNTDVKRVFFSSSSEVYGEPVELPQNEITTPLNSRLPYAVVKNVGESYCRSFYQEFNLNYTIFRFFNTYGPKQSKDFVMSKFIALAKANNDITIYGDGSQTRTFCFIEDNIEATINSLEKELFVNEVINVGSDEILSIRELAEKIVTKLNSKSKIINLPPLAEGDMTRRMPDISNMRKLLGKDLVTIDRGIEILLSSESNNQNRNQ